MSGLDQRDVEILAYYARRGNRELYWNYLAQHAGSDGYGLLGWAWSATTACPAPPPTPAHRRMPGITTAGP